MPCLNCLKGNRPSHRFTLEQSARPISNLLGTSTGDMPGRVLDVTAFPMLEIYAGRGHCRAFRWSCWTTIHLAKEGCDSAVLSKAYCNLTISTASAPGKLLKAASKGRLLPYFENIDTNQHSPVKSTLQGLATGNGDALLFLTRARFYLMIS